MTTLCVYVDRPISVTHAYLGVGFVGFHSRLGASTGQDSQRGRHRDVHICEGEMQRLQRAHSGASVQSRVRPSWMSIRGLFVTLWPTDQPVSLRTSWSMLRLNRAMQYTLAITGSTAGVRCDVNVSCFVRCRLPNCAAGSGKQTFCSVPFGSCRLVSPALGLFLATST